MSEREQSIIKDYKIFLGGAGIGSIVAECALRFGFEHITIVDGDKVEESNLNRQNYTENDIGRYKAECLAERLLNINPNAQIDFHTKFLTPDNIEKLLNGHDVAINAREFGGAAGFLYIENHPNLLPRLKRTAHDAFAIARKLRIALTIVEGMHAINVLRRDGSACDVFKGDARGGRLGLRFGRSSCGNGGFLAKSKP